MAGKSIVNFSGLIALVPNKKAMRVLVVDGSDRPHTGLPADPKFDEPEFFAPHFPFIHFRLADLDPDSPRLPDLTGGGNGICFLSYEELVLGEPNGNGEKDSLEFKIGPPAAALPATAVAMGGRTNASPKSRFYPWPQAGAANSALRAAGARPSPPPVDDLSWVLPLHTACGRKSIKVNTDTLNMRQPPDVIARTRLANGKLYSREFAQRSIAGEERVALFDYKRGKKTYPGQALATVVAYEPRTNGQLVIRSTAWRHGESGSELPPLIFRPPEERDVVANLWNAPLKDIADLLVGKRSHEIAGPTGNRSFRSYYRLVEGPPAALPELDNVDYVAARYAGGGDEGGKGVGCPCCRFAASKYA